MGDDAEKLVGRVGFHDGAGIDADTQTQCGEGVQVITGDQQVMYAVGVKAGGFQEYLNAFEKAGQACKRCRSVIVKRKVSGRVTFACEECQV